MFVRTSLERAWSPPSPASSLRSTQQPALRVAGPTALDLSAVRVSAAPTAVQAKLVLGAPGDRFEQEADAVADRVMREEDPALRSGGAGAVVQRKCASCEQEDEERVMAEAAPGGLGGLSAASAAGIQSARGGGSALDRAARARLEPRFGVSFADVRVHADARAASLARGIGARAFTLGHDVFFGEGQYRPGSPEGQRLLAHELTHVLQQGARPYAVGPLRLGCTEGPVLRRFGEEDEQAGGEGPVLAVRISCEDDVIVFETATGSHGYHLDTCSVPIGEYTVNVKTSGHDFRFDFRPSDTQDQRFEFGFDVEPGQENPTSLLRGQPQVPVSVVEHIGYSMGIAAPLPTRLRLFVELVKSAGQVRMAQNRATLDAWLVELTKKLTPEQVQASVHAQEAQVVLDQASQSGLAEQALAEQWLNTPGPGQRWVIEKKIGGEYQACTGCHAAVQADESDARLRESGRTLLTPLQMLRRDAPPGAAPPSASTGEPGSASQEASALIASIQPMLQALGPAGYKVLPPETLGRTDSSSALLSDIERRIHGRQADYQTFSDRIEEPSFDYLELRPIVRDLLPLADQDVREAVEAEIASAEQWEVVEAVVVGGATVGLLLLVVFPPTTALGATGALALGAGLSAHQVVTGLEDFERGSLYALGTGADDVLDPAQQQAADALMVSGVLNTVLGGIGLASAGLGTMRLIRPTPTGPLTGAQGRTGNTLIEVEGFGTSNPRIRVYQNGQLVREGPLSSFRAPPGAQGASPAASSRASSTAPSGAGSTMLYTDEGGAARVAVPVPWEEPVPVPVTSPARGAPAAQSPYLDDVLATTAGTNAARAPIRAATEQPAPREEPRIEPRVDEETQRRSCAQSYPQVRICASLPSEYQFSSAQQALARMKQIEGKNNIRFHGNAAITTRGPCPGTGQHYNVRDGAERVGSVTCCPCCADTPQGPSVQTRCRIVW